MQAQDDRKKLIQKLLTASWFNKHLRVIKRRNSYGNITDYIKTRG